MIKQMERIQKEKYTVEMHRDYLNKLMDEMAYNPEMDTHLREIEKGNAREREGERDTNPYVV